MGKRNTTRVSEEEGEDASEYQEPIGASSSNQKTLYEILGVEKTASQQEIKKAYYKLALRLHPDKNPAGDEDAKEKFQQLQKVISILGDEEKRALYDQAGCVEDAMVDPVGERSSSNMPTQADPSSDDTTPRPSVLGRVSRPSVFDRPPRHSVLENTSRSTIATDIPTPTQGKRQKVAWEQRTPASGGPEIPDQIPSYSGHIAVDIWNGLEREMLKVQTRKEAVAREWTELTNDRMTNHWVTLSGLGHLRKCMYTYHDDALICAFVERWQPDTNSFHMPWGEMTITLHDVFHLLSIPIAGFSVNDPEIIRSTLVNEIAKCLIMDPEDLSRDIKDKGIHIKYLEQAGKAEVTDSVDRAKIYLCYVLGTTLFVDRSWDKVNWRIWGSLMDISRVGRFSWGSAVLAALYRQLGQASRACCKSLGGCMTLFEGWIYSYFPNLISQDRVNPNWNSSQPYVLKYIAEKVDHKQLSRLRQYRKTLDDMDVEEVNFTPFMTFTLDHPEGWVSAYHGTIRFAQIVEPYMPDRCLRQFGYVQRVPKMRILPSDHYRPRETVKYKAIYAWVQAFWEQVHVHSFSKSFMGDRAYPSYAVESGYLEWFRLRSHIRIQPVIGRVPRKVRDREFVESMSAIIKSVDDPAQLTHRQVVELWGQMQTLVDRVEHAGPGGDR